MKTLQAIGRIARREVREILADRWTLVAVTLMPLIAGVLLTALYAHRIVEDLPVGVIDEDRSATSRMLIRAFDAHQSISVVPLDAPSSSAEEIMRREDYTGLIVIRSGFEADLKQGKQSPVLLYLDNSNMVSGNALLKAASTTAGTVSAGVALQKALRGGALGESSLALVQPVAVQAHNMFNPAQSYSDFFVPGILAALLQQIVVIGAALTWVREFRSGKITQLLAEERHLGVIIAGKLLVYVAIGLVWAVVLFAGLFGAVGVPYAGSISAGLASVALMVVAMGLLAMMISSFFEHRETAIQITFLVSSPAFLVSGYTFPAIAMTAPARWVGSIIPLTPFLTAWRRLVLYGAGWSDIAVQLGLMCLMLLITVLVMIVRLRMRINLHTGPAEDPVPHVLPHGVHHPIREELHRMMADRNILLVLVIAPLVYTLVFGLTYYNGKVYDLPIVVVDESHTDVSRSIIRALDAHESISVARVVADEGVVRNMMVREECWAAVVLPRDLVTDLKQGKQVTVPVFVNTSNIIIGNYAWKGAQTVLGTTGAMIGMDRMVRKGVSAAVVRASYSPVDLQTRTLFNPASNYAFFVIPLLIILLVHQVVALGAAMSAAKHADDHTDALVASAAMERGVRGLLMRITHIQSRLVPYVIGGAAWIIISIVATLPWLGIPRPASLTGAVLLGILISWNASLLGTLAGSLVKDKIGVVQVLFFTSMPLLLLSGGSWPQQSMPWAVRALALVLPTTHAMNGYRMLALEGGSFFHALPVLAVLALIGVVLSVVNALAVRLVHDSSTAA
jgi:ABC-2 type transport system permease protein